MECLADRTVHEFVHGELNATEISVVDDHLDACDTCQALVVEVVRAMATSSGAESTNATTTTLSRGASVGRHTVLHILGRGGMGVVYAAYDGDLDRKVALKLLHIDNAQTDWLKLEAKALAKLSHPNVTTVYEVGSLGPSIFLAMEFVDGQTLASWSAEEKRSWQEVLQVYVQAGRGLAAAHAEGIVHRDFKPQNVLIGKDARVLVTDFGLAHVATEPSGASVGDFDSATHTFTTTGGIAGTPAYMAPEQFLGEETTARSDQYGFCVALYEALFGTRPFSGGSLAELKAAVVEGDISGLDRDTTGVPRWLRRAVLKGIARTPSERHASMNELLAVLSQQRGIRWSTWVAGASACVAISLVAYSMMGSGSKAPIVCTGAAEKVEGIWGAQAQDLVARRFREKGDTEGKHFSEVDQRLRGYGQAWSAMHKDSCEATSVRGEQSEQLLDVRSICLEDRLRELGALTSLLAKADDKLVTSAEKAARALTSLNGCADSRALLAPNRPPSDPASQQALDSARTLIAEAKALRDTAQYELGIETAGKAVTAMREIGYRPLESEALFLVGEMQGRVKGNKAAETTLYESAWAAEASRHDDMAARAWVKLIFHVGYRQARYADAYRIGHQAKAAIERLGGSDEIEAKRLSALGIVYWTEGRHEEARQHLEPALVLIESVYGTEHPDVAANISDLATVYNALGQVERSIALHHRALAMREKLLGAKHPDLASSLNNLGAVLAKQEDYEGAEKLFTRALGIAEDALGPHHLHVSFTLENVSQIQLKRGAPEAALKTSLRALAIQRAQWGEDHPGLAYTLTGLGRIYTELGDSPQAQEHLEKALALRIKEKGDVIGLAETKFELAQAIGSKDLSRAQTLAHDALTTYKQAGATASKELAEVESWMASETIQK